MEQILNKIESMELILKEGGALKLEDIKSIEEILDGLENQTNAGSIENTIKRKFLNLKSKYLKNNNSNPTKWMLFCNDMEKLNDIEPIMELIDYVNIRKDNVITKDELQTLEDMYTNILGVIHEKLSPYDRDRAINEFNKKIKLFNNRLSRQIEDDFGAWIKQLRLDKGYTLKDLETHSGVSASYIHRIESGSKQIPSLSVAEKLAHSLGVNTEEVLKMLNVNISEGSIENNFRFNNEPITFADLLQSNQIVLNNIEMDNTQKEALIDIFNLILNSEWSQNSKFTDSMTIMNQIDIFKSLF